jgi:iron complex transport system permease protein
VDAEPSTGSPEVPRAPSRRGQGFAVSAPSRGFVLALVAFTCACAVLGLVVGRGGAGSSVLDPLFLMMRAQRTAVAFCSGAAVAVAGAVVQGLFRNPLANPQILGTTAGAVLGAHVALLATVLIFGGGSAYPVAPEMMVPIGALIGACLSLFALLAVASLRVGLLTLLLTGWGLMSLFQGASTFLNNLFQEAWELNRALAALNLGSISASGPKQVVLVLVMTVGGCLPIWLSSSTLDVLLTGDEEALTLGVDVQRERFWLVLWVALLTAGAVAVGGSVGFVGLIVPHAMRRFVGQRHRYLLPYTLVGGGAFVMLCDLACRLLPLRVEIPLGVLTDLIGAPVFLHLLLRLARKGQLHG